MEMTDEQAWREQAELENERRIQAWLREQTGLEPATGDYAMALMSLQSEAR
jgi:hypothetical protein